jgi:glycosyltransferase involved in cell wall biosynthesis
VVQTLRAYPESIDRQKNVPILIQGWSKKIQRLNYWLLTTEYPPFHGGGISTYCYFTAKMLAAAGDRVTVFVQDDSVTDYALSEPAPGITLIRFNCNRNGLHGSLGYTARLSYAFADMVRTIIEQKGKPDFIEAQDYQGIAYYLTQFKHAGYAFMADIPILVTLHSPAFIYLEYNRVPTYRFPDFWTGEMEKQAIVAADLLISPTRFLVEEIQRYVDLTGKEVRILANPYEGPGNKELTGSFQRNKIVYYGKLSPQKGSFELLAYFKELWDNGFPHPLHIVGGTDIVYHPEMQTMGQLVNERYSNYIAKGLLQLHGKIQPSQIKEYLQDAHVILVPSIVDNLPYVVMEAMSLGKIVLASRQGGQREMIEEAVSGFLFDHRDPASFARQLEKVLSLTNDEMQRIGINACQRVHNDYSYDVILAKKKEILEYSKSIPSNRAHFPFLYQEDTRSPVAEPAGDDLLSVVVPYYNMGDYIEECIRSVLGSTYKHLEVLVINDGSTDPASIEKLNLIARLENVRVFHHKNQGLAFTRNYGAELAKGTFLAFLDADDKVAPTYYEKAVVALQRNRNVHFAGAWVKYFGNSTQLWPTFTPQPPFVLVHNPVNSSGLVYKRAAFLAGGLNDKQVDYGLEDYESVVSMLHGGYNGIVLPEPLFHYRVRTGSMIRNISMEKLLYSNKYINEKHADYYAKFAPQVINLLNANGPGYLFDNPTFEVRVVTRRAGESIILLKIKALVKRNEQLKKIALTIKKLKR